LRFVIAAKQEYRNECNILQIIPRRIFCAFAQSIVMPLATLKRRKKRRFLEAQYAQNDYSFAQKRLIDIDTGRLLTKRRRLNLVAIKLSSPGQEQSTEPGNGQ
jgi:hypothetical protein